MATKYQLKNGLNVLLVESHKSPVVSVQMWVKTGSADEPKGLEGVSHFIEHLVFKGTDHFKVGEIASKVEGEGGELNAYTSFDKTVYHVTISKEFTETGLEVISEMMGHPTFDPEEIDNERGVVIEEIKRGQDSPARQASKALFETVYKKHPYGMPVIGYEKIIEKVSAKKIKEYFEQRYVPKNMTLVVTGDFETKDMKKLVAKYYNSFVPRPLKRAARKKEEKQEKPRISVRQCSFEETLLHIAWRTPKANHKDIPGLDMLCMVLGHGDSSRLMRSLRIERPLSNYTVASTYTPKDPGFMVVSSSLNYENIEEALDELNTQIMKICSEPPTMEELNRVRTIVEGGEFFALETVDGMASKYGTYEDLFGDYKYYKEFLKAIQEITPGDLVKLARKYLKPESMTLVMMCSEDPKEARKPLAKWIRTYTKSFEQIKSVKVQIPPVKKIKKIKLKLSGRSSDEKIEKIALKSGATLIVKPNHETPVVSLKTAFLGGLRSELSGELGTNELLSRTWSAGTNDISEQKLYELTEGMATNLKTFSGRNTAGISMTCLSPFVDQSMGIYLEVLKKPAFDDSVISREKIYLKEYIKNRADNPAQLCVLDFLGTVFKNHPYGKDSFGTFESVDQLSRSQVNRHWQKMVTAKNLNMVLVGDVDVDRWVEKMEDFTMSLPSGERIASEFPLDELTSPVYNFVKSEKQQSHIVYGFRGLTFDDENKFDLQIIQAILAGQGGRLFLELRDKESLAYSVSPLRMDGIDAGYFGAYIGCSPEKGKKAISMMKVEFDKLMEMPVDGEELLRAKRYLIGSHDINLQRNSSQASAMLFDDIYGVPYDESFRYSENLKRVTPESLQKVAQKLFDQNEVISVVGAENPF